MTDGCCPGASSWILRNEPGRDGNTAGCRGGFHANFVNVSCKIHTFVMIWQKDL